MESIVEQVEFQVTEIESLSAIERIKWANRKFGDDLVLSTSFGIQSAVMLHMATQVNPHIRVVFIDTGYLFDETYRYARELTERFKLNIKKYQPLMSAAEQESLEGKLWEQGEKKLKEYNFTRKVEPMNRALLDLKAKAWMAGLRRDQASTRKLLKVVTKQNNMYKIYPIIDFIDEDIDHYMLKHDLPYHPLRKEGYVSLGDWHSTKKLKEGITAEETRFNGMKRECGLHESTNLVDYQI